MAAGITVDELVVIINAQTKDFKRQVAAINDQLEGIGKQGRKTSSSMSSSFAAIGKAAKAGLVVGVVGGIAAITASIPAAVRRVDTLNNASRTFENMGIKSGDAKKAMDNLNKSILGLPTPLDSAVRGMTALTATYGDINKGQKVFSALNDAILGFGGSTEAVDNAILQLSQRPMDGPLDAQTWNSLLQSGLTPVINAMAKDMGKSVGEMKDDFGSGKLTVEDFTDKLVEMDTKGGGGMKSLQKIAKDSTAGIGTSFANLKTAMTRSVANVIKALGPENFSGAINGMAGVVDDIGKKIVGEIPNIRDGVQKALASIFDFGQLLKTGNLTEAGKQLGTAIGNGIATAIKALRIGMDTIRAWFASIDWGQVGIAVGTGALAFVGGLVVGLFSTESLMQFVGFIADNWVAVLLTVASIAFAPAKLLGPIGKLFSGIISKIPFGGFFVSAFGKIVGAIRAMGAPIRDAFSGAIVAPIKGFVKALVTDIGIRFLYVIDYATLPFRKAVQLIAGIIKAIPKAVSLVVTNIKNIFAPIANWLGSLFSRGASNIRSALSPITNFVGGIVSGIKSRFGGIVAWFSSKFNSIKNAIGRINWETVGIDIIKGIGRGIKNMGGWLADQAKAAVGAAKDKLKSFLGIHSPSRVMRDEVGKMMGLGIAEGIDQSTKNAMKSATNSAKHILGAYGGSFNTNLPSASRLGGKLDLSVASMPDAAGRQTPVNVQIDGNTLLSFVIDGINNKAFMTNRSAIDY